MYGTNEFRKGLKIEIDGEPYMMVDCQFVKPGKGNAFTHSLIHISEPTRPRLVSRKPSYA